MLPASPSPPPGGPSRQLMLLLSTASRQGALISYVITTVYKYCISGAPEVATWSITFSPITDGDPNTQNTSASGGRTRGIEKRGGWVARMVRASGLDGRHT